MVFPTRGAAVAAPAPIIDKGTLMKRFAIPAAGVLAAALFGCMPLAQAADYAVDPAHSFVQWRIQHLGYSWLYGRFNTLSGEFSHDPDKPEASRITVQVDTASVDSNHAERDKHLRNDDFLDVGKFPEAMFNSTGYSGSAEEGTMTGELTPCTLRAAMRSQCRTPAASATFWLPRYHTALALPSASAIMPSALCVSSASLYQRS
jgi:hypothetical protein